MKKNPVNMQKKIFKTYLIITAFILIVFTLFFYFYVSRKLINEEKQALNEVNSSIQTQVEYSIQGMDIVSNNINYSSLIGEKLNPDFSLNTEHGSLKELSDLLSSINGTDVRTDLINLFDLSGNKISYGLLTRTDRVDLDSLPWLKKTLSLNGRKYISLPQYSEKTMNFSNWSLSLYRTFTNSHGRTIGMIETNKSCKSIFQVIQRYKKESNQSADVYIFSDSGKIIYPYDSDNIDHKACRKYYNIASSAASATAKNNTVIQNNTKGTNEILSYSYSPYTGWTYLLIQQEDVILQPVHTMVKFLLFFSFLLMLSTFPLSYIMSKNLVNPIKYLRHMIQSMEIRTLGEIKDLTYHSNIQETEELYQAFYHMSLRLKESMDELVKTRQQEEKSQYLALQSQINPHFYYNSLSSISVLAENGQPDEIVTMCKNLSTIMRYITDGSSMTVTLKEEVDYVNRYLYCMKIRYQSSLNYSVTIEDALMDTPVPKLLLQPLVENALKYGTESIPPWNISVVGKIYKDRWQIDVLDSGPGFTDESIQQLHQKIKEVSSRHGIPSLQIGGMGIINIYCRWKLYCGENTLFSFENTREGHGKVSIGCYNKSEQTMNKKKEVQ